MASSFVISAGILSALVIAAASASSDVKHVEFPLLMPKIQPRRVDDYLCTPVRLAEDAPGYVVGFRPNSTHHIAHHMLVYGCAEPGGDGMGHVWNCGEMASDGDDGMVHR